MHLPNYFIADLPSDAVTATVLEQACETLLQNRAKFLAGRSTESLIRTISSVGEQWLDPQYPIRKLALAEGVKETGFSLPVLRNGLESFFQQLTRENLLALVEQDLGAVRRIDELCANEPERKTNRASLALPPALLVHITAGTLPNSAFTSIVLGLLLRSAQFVKCASGKSLLPRLFAHSIYEHDPKLGACLELAEWPGGKEAFEEVLLPRAQCVTVSGTDETVATLRNRVPPACRLVAYGHRVSFGFISSGSLTGLQAPRTVTRAGADIAAWDQLGCLSPHVFYVESGGGLEPVQFAEALARELEALETVQPRGAISPYEAANIQSRRAFYEVRAAHSAETRLWSSPRSTAWTVVYESAPLFQLSCLNRFIYVKSVRDLTEALHGADAVRDKVSTVGLAAPEDRAQALATELARWGATRVCPLGRMQQPPLAWRHDGRPALAEFVTWADWEM